MIRAYRLAAEPFNMAPTVQEDQPAVVLDWLLHLHDAVTARQNREAQ